MKNSEQPEKPYKFELSIKPQPIAAADRKAVGEVARSARVVVITAC